jgi:hypothetical protein
VEILSNNNYYIAKSENLKAKSKKMYKTQLFLADQTFVLLHRHLFPFAFILSPQKLTFAAYYGTPNTG